MSKKLIMLIAMLLIGVGLITGAFRVGFFIGAQCTLTMRTTRGI